VPVSKFSLMCNLRGICPGDVISWISIRLAPVSVHLVPTTNARTESSIERSKYGCKFAYVTYISVTSLEVKSSKVNVNISPSVYVCIGKEVKPPTALTRSSSSPP